MVHLTVALISQFTSPQEIRSQTPSPAGIPKTTEIVRSERYGSGSTQSSDHGGGYDHIRGPSPSQGLGYLDSIRGPLPPPGHLLTMKTPFYRGSRSPLNFPLFPACQRRWSETAAVQSAAVDDADGHVRRWSMPWESITDKLTPCTRIPLSKLAGPISRSGYEHNTGAIRRPSYGEQVPGPIGRPPDEQDADSSIDGLAEAIQLLSMPKLRPVPPTVQQPPPPPPQQEGLYGIWSSRNALPPYWSYMREHDENAPK